MADEYFSVNRFPGDGVTTQHELTFAGGYISKAHVKAYILDAAGGKTAIAVTDAMFVGPYTLNLDVAAPVGGETVIYRDTPKAAPLVDFQKGARITEANLDKTTQQAIFGVAEIYDAANAAGVVVADVVTAAAAAGAARDAAQASQDAAATSATAASSSATSASTSATDAANSASSASTSATNAAASATDASSSASGASTSEANAAASATSAADSATAAADSASQAAASAASVNDTNLVHKTGDETIGGVKTFSSPIVGSTDSQVSLTGDQTVEGSKTFSSPIIGSVSGTAGNVTGTVAVANGGTGATTAAEAFTNLKQAATTTDTGVVELATNAEAQAGTDAVRAITPATLFGGLNASGSAPIYACRAWVNFNGTDTVAIRASGNVSSITDNGVGDYTVNFTTAMPDANYAPIFGGNFNTANGRDNNIGVRSDTPPTTSSLRINVFEPNTGLIDSTFLNVAIFR